MSRKFDKKFHKNQKFNSEFCDDSMTFEECELAILRHAVDESEEHQGKKIANSEEVKKIIKILENFLIDKKCICYGGTAINNILPKYAQFYNKDVEIPDYDFFTPNALADAKELADIYYAAGYVEVEAKSGMHHGTYKVYVNFIPIADITYLDPALFEAINKEAVSVAGIKYAPPNFLRMSMYLELSRPAGDVSRWEKVFKRLSLLNKHYPFAENVKCSGVEFQRKLHTNSHNSEKLYLTVRDSFTEQGVIFFGGYASSLYSKYMPPKQRRFFQHIPDFDVLSEEPERCATIVIERLRDNGFTNAEKIVHGPIGELIPEHIEIRVGKDTIAFIYYPIACHNYNTIHLGSVEVNVATIDTMLSFYLAFIYAEEYMPFKDRILCMAKFLFQVEEENKLEQKGLLKRFSLNCVGKQPSLEDIRAEKAEKFKELANKKGSLEYEEWFLKYNPSEKKDGKKTKSKKEESKEPVQVPEKEKEPEQEPEPKTEKKEENNVIASLPKMKLPGFLSPTKKYKKRKPRNYNKTRKYINKRKDDGYLY